MHKKWLRPIFGLVLLSLAGATLLWGACVTPTNYVYCSDCPFLNGNCYPSCHWSYSVLGERVETWCNQSEQGWCSYYIGCTTISSISTARDCNGNITAFQATICCYSGCC
jgi:hypothetical protein